MVTLHATLVAENVIQEVLIDLICEIFDTRQVAKKVFDFSAAFWAALQAPHVRPVGGHLEHPRTSYSQFFVLPRNLVKTGLL